MTNLYSAWKRSKQPVFIDVYTRLRQKAKCRRGLFHTLSPCPCSSKARHGLGLTFALCGMCLEGKQRLLELWCSAVPVLPWAGGDVNKGGEGESFHQLPVSSQHDGKPESRKHYSIVFWNWLNMSKITVLMINTVINIGRTWIQDPQRLLFFCDNYKSSSNNFFFFFNHIFKVYYSAPLSRLPYGEINGF